MKKHLLKCYYAHPMILYGSSTERKDLNTIKKMGYSVINPNTPSISKELNKYKKKHPTDYMNYFLELVETVDIVVFRSLRNGKITSGVVMEIEHATRKGIPVIEMPTNVSKRSLSYKETMKLFKS